jgi:hypothetical protein
MLCFRVCLKAARSAFAVAMAVVVVVAMAMAMVVAVLVVVLAFLVCHPRGGSAVAVAVVFALVSEIGRDFSPGIPSHSEIAL